MFDGIANKNKKKVIVKVHPSISEDKFHEQIFSFSAFLSRVSSSVLFLEKVLLMEENIAKISHKVFNE